MPQLDKASFFYISFSTFIFIFLTYPIMVMIFFQPLSNSAFTREERAVIALFNIQNI